MAKKLSTVSCSRDFWSLVRELKNQTQNKKSSQISVHEFTHTLMTS